MRIGQEKIDWIGIRIYATFSEVCPSHPIKAVNKTKGWRKSNSGKQGPELSTMINWIPIIIPITIGLVHVRHILWFYSQGSFLAEHVLFTIQCRITSICAIWVGLYSTITEKAKLNKILFFFPKLKNRIHFNKSWRGTYNQMYFVCSQVHGPATGWACKGGGGGGAWALTYKRQFAV